ncbi:MAG: guanylate kinase [Verrucomicrobiales bacterium]|nr:guanylate kinase [Verrucomicrobiales bacterium]|tara:strand:+ start:4092 stop:4721 length:630 start_codon:yes stop_codon:yes gene_type:complete
MAAKQKPSPLLLVVSAPSGAGKTTLCNRLLRSSPNVARAITCTTRDPRPGEKDGKDYYFLRAADFLKRVQAGNFLEHATVHGSSYGILKSEITSKLRAGEDVVLAVDVQGAATIRKQAMEDKRLCEALVEVFILPPSIAELRRRLQGRRSETAATLRKRLAEAKHEITQWKHYDYVILSGTKSQDFQKFKAIYEAEKLRQHRVSTPNIR